MELSEAIAELHSQLLDFESEKKRVERAINEQREREAAQKRQEEYERQQAAERERLRQEQAERERLAEIRRKSLEAANEKLKAECAAAYAAEQERQREADAKRELERQAEQQRLAAVVAMPFETPKTEGLNVKVCFEFDVEDPVKFLLWCAANKPHWINISKLSEAFYKREVMEAINIPGNGLSISGVRVFQALGAAVKKTKPSRTMTVQSQRVEL
jgi:hypothetical protein